MPITPQEISNRALAFSREWKHAESEDADTKSFWDGFFEVFGVSRRRLASFEKRAKKIDGKDGCIDLLWKGTCLGLLGVSSFAQLTPQRVIAAAPVNEPGALSAFPLLGDFPDWND